MAALAAALVGRGAEAIIAGCTEIPLVLGENALDVPLISSTDVLAARTVAIARGEAPLPGQE
jgi:aspartate racemase